MIKLKYLFFGLCILLVSKQTAYTQTLNQRTATSSRVNQSELKSFKTTLQVKFKISEKKVSDYLIKNPDKQRTFVKNGSLYYLKGIDSAGNPIYVNTKNKASGELVKADQLYSGGSLGVNITGTGMVVGVWDGGQVRSTHELLLGKVAMQSGQTLDGSGGNYSGNNHQSHVSGTLVGKDIVSQPSARGIANGATALNFDFDNDIAEMTTFATGGYLISNHSYGASNDDTVPVWRFGAYDGEARDWDILIKNAPYYLPFVAAGNEQQSNGNSSKLGYDLMTGSSAAKNVITVGAINGNKDMSDYSNWGPTDDGRLKPEIVAKGTGINSSTFVNKTTNIPSDNSYSGNDESSSGTSYSTPAVAASSLLLQQYYFSLHGSYMMASTLKALILGTAEDLGQPGPDNKFGWGLLNVEKAARVIRSKSVSGNPSVAISVDNVTNESYFQEITYNPIANSSDEMIRTVTAGGCEPLIVSIAWTDDEGAEQVDTDGIDPTGSKLIYDFDMLVKEFNVPFDNSIRSENRPWKPSNMANRIADATFQTNWFDGNGNNYKQVRIDNPVPGSVIQIAIRKKTGSPSTARIVSLVVSGTSLPKPKLF